MNALKLHILAQKAANDFVEGGTTLNDALLKVAQEEGLNQLHIKRVTELANHRANDLLRKTAEDKTFQFELGDFNEVVNQLNGVSESPDLMKVSSVLDEMTREGEETLLNRLDKLPTMSKEAEEAMARSTVADLEKIASRAESEVAYASAKLLANTSDLGADLEKLAAAAKNFIYMDGGRLDDLNKYAQLHDPDFADQWFKVFSFVGEELKKTAEPYLGALADKVELEADYPSRFPADLAPTRFPTGFPEGADTMALRDVDFQPQICVENGHGSLESILVPIRQKLSISEALKNWKHQMDSLASTVRTCQRVITNSNSVHPEIYSYTQGLCKVAEQGGIGTIPPAKDKKGLKDNMKDYFKKSYEKARTDFHTPKRVY